MKTGFGYDKARREALEAVILEVIRRREDRHTDAIAEERESVAACMTWARWCELDNLVTDLIRLSGREPRLRLEPPVPPENIMISDPTSTGLTWLLVAAVLGSVIVVLFGVFGP